MPEETLYGVMVNHDVADFDAWMTAFSAHEGKRREAGIILHAVHRNEENPNNVLVYLASRDLDSLKAFAGSDDLKDAMKDAGVTSPPTINFVRNREMDISADKEADSGLVVMHEVEDYDRWKKSYDDHASVRENAGALGTSVSTAADNDKQVTVYLQFPSHEKSRPFVDQPELKEAMSAAGVVGPPQFLFLNRVEMKNYD